MEPESLTPPDGWRWGFLKDLCERVSVGYVSSTRDFFCNPGEGVRLVRSQNIRPGRLILEDTAWVTRDFHEANPKSQLKPGDILITRVGANAGDVCIVPEGIGDLHCSSAVYARPLPQHAKYLELFCRSDIGQYLLRARIVGSVSERINTRDAEVLPVLVPPIPEQKRIAHVLGTLDDKIDLNRRMNATLEGISRAIFKSWFVDFDPVRQKAAGKRPVGMDAQTAALFPDSFEDSEIGEVPKGWAIAEVRDFLSLSRESVDPSLHPTETFDHYSIPAFDNYCWPASDAGSEIKSQKLLVAPGSVLISKLNPRTPRVWIPQAGHTRRRVASTEFLVAVPNETTGVGVPFVFCFASTESVVEYLASHASGTSNSHQRVRPDDFLRLRTALPANALLEAFDRVVKPLIQRSNQVRSESRTVAALRDTLLPKLLSGEVRVPEAEEAVEEVLS